MLSCHVLVRTLSDLLSQDLKTVRVGKAIIVCGANAEIAVRTDDLPDPGS